MTAQVQAFAELVPTKPVVTRARLVGTSFLGRRAPMLPPPSRRSRPTPNPAPFPFTRNDQS